MGKVAASATGKMATHGGPKIFQLIKRGFIEIPEMMGGAVIAISALGIGAYALHKNNQKLVVRPFKDNYIVIRDDDPRAEAYKKFHEKPVY